jgi:rhamnosyltransferase
MPVWRQFVDAVDAQTFQPFRKVMIDSSSCDGSRELATERGWDVHVIASANFDHGGTRRRAFEICCADAEVGLFLTQDSILAEPRAIEKLLRCFRDETVGAVYGRQLPRPGAGAIEAHSRLFNYPEKGEIRGMDAVATRGLRTAFFSNSWGGYRMSAVRKADALPKRAICSEDLYAAARILEAGYRVAYAADATVWHSHGFSVAEEFRRYFDIGVFHREQGWIPDHFGGAGREGLAYVRSELAYLARRAPGRIPEALLRNLSKYLAFRSGKAYRRLPRWLTPYLSASVNHWRDQALASPGASADTGEVSSR